MSQYYYTVASLPLLLYEMEKHFPIDTFLELCREQLSERDLSLLLAAAGFGLEKLQPLCSLLEKWLRWEISVRNELVKLRAQRRGEEAQEFLRREGVEIPAVQEIARNAFSQDSPLAAEDILLRARWDYLDELELGHYFDIEKIIVYYLRLQLLERKALFKREEGLVRFQEIYHSITKEYGTEA